MNRSYRLAAAPLLAVLFAGVAQADDKPSFDRSFDVAPAPVVQVSQRWTGQVTTTDSRTGLPSFVWGQLETPALPAGAAPADAALAHIRAYAPLYALSARSLATVRVSEVHDTGRGGILVRLEQAVDGIPVIGSGAKILMRRDRALVAIGGNLRPDATPELAKRATYGLPRATVVARVLSDLYDASIPASVVGAASPEDALGYTHFDVAPGGPVRFERPARVRRVWFPVGGALVAAYYVEVFSSTGVRGWDAYAYVVDATTAEVLRRRNLTDHAAFSYRVHADTSGDLRPLDGPVADFTPHPTGVPDRSYPGFVAPSLVTIDGFNIHADPWLSANATEALGNNVDAFTDRDGTDSISPGDTRAQTTAPGVFDHTYDPLSSPTASPTQAMAGVTQVFYTTNWLHDYWYDSGFDEAAGNAQLDNYNRGGAGGDRLRCETQDDLDAGAANNANMATPADGASPRMQIYVWSGAQSASLAVDALPNAPETGTAAFGAGSFDVTGAVVLVDDATATVTDACEPIGNSIAGQIALIDRGSCSFQSKAARAEAAGAIGVIIANNQGGPPPAMPGDGGAAVGIPVLSVSQADGVTIKAALGAGPVSATMQRQNGAAADAAVDNLVVAHEWGHYLHHRLVDCGLNQCGGESEGWGDFLALSLAVREGDDLSGTFSPAVYATIANPDAAYFGTRRYPYSTDLSKSPLTFQHIQASAVLPGGPPMSPGVPFNAEVHNTGEVFAAMLFEGYVSMLAASAEPNPPHSFDEARRKMADYVVAGMKLAPTEPTFTEQRDAIIAAAFAADPEDALVIAEGFAKRGAGSCAVSPPRDSFDNEGVVESFDVAPAVSIVSVAVTDGPASCDDDGIVDVGETGRVVVTLANRGFLDAPATTVTLSADDAGLAFPGGASVEVPTLAGFATVEIPFEVSLAGANAPTQVKIVATAKNPASCTPSVVSETFTRVHYDESPASSTKDDFESGIDAWSLDGDASELVWTRATEDDGNHLWHGVDYASLSDTALVSPSVTASASEAFVLSFSHRYKFEASESNGTFVTWDGSVIEYSVDGGSSWDDVSTLVDPGYTGTIGDLAENPLSNREGYVAESPGWPDMQPVTLDFGSQLAGQTVVFRFRIGSDQAASDVGWFIDDVSVLGAEGAPFPAVVEDAGACGADADLPPIADAGPDQRARAGDAVVLDGSGSRDPDADALTFEWISEAGGPVPLVVDGARASFVAPEVDEIAELSFRLTVTSNGASAIDTVKVVIEPGDGSEGLDAAGGCHCRAAPGEREPAGWGALLGLTLAAARMARRALRSRRTSG
ncbi:MAG: M36 family metallopeptidase [Myxococcales bacterium]|nr:M36 family metallopeptidase [Myxococcales bacterium]